MTKIIIGLFLALLFSVGFHFYHLFTNEEMIARSWWYDQYCKVMIIVIWGGAIWSILAFYDYLDRLKGIV